MAKQEIWSLVAGERAALADDLANLTPEQWDASSQCDGWTVRDVVAHMTASAMITPPAFFAKVVGSGFSLKRMQQKDIARERGSSNADALARFRAQINSTKHPPGPTEAWLGEAFIHSEDVRRPLGITRDYPADGAVKVAEFYKGSNLVVGAKSRIAGLHLQATDADWSHGDGPSVSGPIMALVMAMTGRKQALADLSGDGVATLHERG